WAARIPSGIYRDEAAENAVGDQILVQVKVCDRDRVARQFVQKKLRIIDCENPLKVRYVGSLDTHLESAAVDERHRFVNRGRGSVGSGSDLCLRPARRRKANK